MELHDSPILQLIEIENVVSSYGYLHETSLYYHFCDYFYYLCELSYSPREKMQRNPSFPFHENSLIFSSNINGEKRRRYWARIAFLIVSLYSSTLVQTTPVRLLKNAYEKLYRQYQNRYLCFRHNNDQKTSSEIVRVFDVGIHIYVLPISVINMR